VQNPRQQTAAATAAATERRMDDLPTLGE